MTTFSSPELVQAVISERRDRAAHERLARAFRLAQTCCSTAVSPIRRLFRRPAPTTC